MNEEPGCSPAHRNLIGLQHSVLCSHRAGEESLLPAADTDTEAATHGVSTACSDHWLYSQWLRPTVSVTFEQPVMTNFSWHYKVWCVRPALTAKLALYQYHGMHCSIYMLYPVSQKQRFLQSLILLFGLKRLGHYRLASSCHVFTWHNMRFFPVLFLVVKAHKSTWLQPDPSRLKGAVCSRCSFKL